MSAQDLSFPELLDATRAWVEGPVSEFLRESPIASPFMGRFDRLRGTIASAPPESSELGQLTERLGETDADHDELVRFLVAFLASFTHYGEAAIEALAKSLSTALIPEGASLVSKSYGDEAGRYETRQAVATAEVRAQLASFPLPEGKTLLQKFERLQAVTLLLGQLLERRRALGGASGPTAGELLNAKRGLTALITQIFQSYGLLEDELDATARAKVDALEAAWRRAVGEATARATARRRAAEGVTTGGPTGPATS